MSKLWLGLAALMLFTAAQAADELVVEKPLIAQNLDGFKREAATIRDGMNPGGRYEFLKAAEKSKIEARLTSMQSLLESHATQNDLNSRDKISLANMQEEVNATLKHNDSNRLICERRAPVGSHIPVNTCRTYGDIEQERRDTMKGVNDLSNAARLGPNNKPPGGN